MRRTIIMKAAVAAFAVCSIISSCNSTRQPAEPAACNAELLESFMNPPADCRPRVWWHWMNGNITKDGIRKDLLWMKEAGIGGVQVFDAGLGVPQMIPQRVAFMTPAWKDAFSYAVDLADSLGFEFAAAAAGGWSDTGGPWVTCDQAMKTLNWKQMDIKGGGKVRAALPQANKIAGKYLTHSFFSPNRPEYDYYRDIAVIAVKVQDRDIPLEEAGAVLRTSDGSDASGLLDGDLNGVCLVAPGPDGRAWIQFEFPQNSTLSSFFMARKDDWAVKDVRHWEASADGIVFTRVDFDFPHLNIPFISYDVPPTQGRFFRLVSDVPGESLDYTELRIYPCARVHLDTEKAGFFTAQGVRDGFATPVSADASPLEDVLDLTAFCKDGVLDWDAPEGRWRVYRFGYTIRGRRNNPASPEAAGLETDKLDADVTRSYYRTYLGMMNDACGGRLGKVMNYLMIDSFEAGCQTWTAKMPQEFLRRRGYELTPWLPALAGQIIGSAEMTERFLQDWRRTLGEMLVEYHYEAADPVLAEFGLKRYTEFHEAGRAFPVDGMEVKRGADIPMGAFWVEPNGLTKTLYEADIREAAAVAHFYGKEKVAAESFTTTGTLRDADGRAQLWDVFPERMKGGADIALSCGLNTFVIHCSPHQPCDDKVPGVALGEYGSWTQRHETWAHEARTWTDYLSRCSYMLRQGKFAADIAYMISETQNLSDRFQDCRPEIPEGYAFDYVNPTLMADPRFEYKALMLDTELEHISIEALRTIRDLASRGVIIAGSEPRTYIGLVDVSEEFDSLVKDIWRSGRKNVVPFSRCAAALAKAGVHEDVDFGVHGSEDLRFVHRVLPDADIYWLSNTGKATGSMWLSFNVSGRRPVLLHPETGGCEPVSYRMKAGRTEVKLDLGEKDAVFVLFDAPSSVRSFTVPEKRSVKESCIDGPWTVAFQQGRGAPESICLAALESLSDNGDAGVKYFSGTAAYSAGFEISALSPDSCYMLQLGKVCSMARVRVNGVDCGLAWKKPFDVDVTQALRVGVNTIEVDVTNGWINRLIGDAQPGAVPVTWAEAYRVSPDEPLHPSGLLGPVVLQEYRLSR